MNSLFLIFAGQDYYPRSGWNDYRGYTDTLEAALEKAANLSCDWWQIVDFTTKTVIKTGSRENVD